LHAFFQAKNGAVWNTSLLQRPATTARFFFLHRQLAPMSEVLADFLHELDAADGDRLGPSPFTLVGPARKPLLHMRLVVRPELFQVATADLLK